jgi:hypothetical protein
MNIEEILNRRSDLSTFLVHLTRQHGGISAIQNLEAILNLQHIQARSALGPARTEALPVGAPDQRVVCFSETPLEHTWTLCEEIPGRSVKLEPYGVVFTKAFGRRTGANPVWYTDITPGHDWIMRAVNRLIDQAKANTAGDPTHEVLKFSPFIEQMGTPAGRKKEFWWEREWRHIGTFYFTLSDVVAVMAPANQHTRLQPFINGINAAGRKPPLLDPRWSPERMVATLSGIARDAGAIPD